VAEPALPAGPPIRPARRWSACSPLDRTDAGLESVKKTHQVAPVGVGPGALPCPLSAATRRQQPDQDMSLTMAQGMKRLGMPIAALLGVALVGLVTMSWFLNRDALRQAVEAQIRAVTGLDLVVNGSIDISVFPGGYV
jgi:AsmA protein